MKLTDRVRNGLLLVAFAIGFTGLCVKSYRQKSATWDEPQHVMRGILGWRGDHRMDPEHPPFLRLWAALPVAFDKTVQLDTAIIDKVSPADWVGLVQFKYARHYLYNVNNADSILYRERFMIVLLGLLLGGLLFAWANEWLGFWPAATALALYALEPNLMAHATLVTTDFGATCFMFGTLYFLWRTNRQNTVWNIAGTILFFALAMVSKFTTVLLIPVIVVLLIVAACRQPNWRRGLAISAGIFAGMLAATWLAIWAVYGFRYAPSADPNWLYRFQNGSPFGDHFPIFARLAVWADDHRLLPNACSQGFLLGQIKAQARGAYLFGQISTTGWWYYFPVAFLLKTPVTLLLLMAGGLVVMLSRWRRLLETPLVILLPPIVIVGISMTQKLNIGLRHILPVYPLAVLLGAVAIAWLMHDWRHKTKSRWGKRALFSPRHWWIVACVGLMAIEARQAYPSPLAFFNIGSGGPKKGSEYLVDSNLDWGQDLKGLKRWMDMNEVKNIYLCYFGTADPAYYGIQYTALPGNGFMDTGKLPTEPGYVAISVTNLRGVYFPANLRQFYAPLLKQEPLRRIGYSIFIYRVDRPWWQ
ncbi:MAG: glycosyltransferase family 39 protein [Verrucomicrobiota bacterium]